VDARLPGGGFPRGGLAELAGGPASGKTGVALSALREAQAGGALVAYVDGRGELYPPAAAELGVDLERLLVVRPGAPRRDAEGAAAGVAGRGHPEEALPGLWAAEALLASGAFAAVAIDVPLRGVPPTRAEAMLRRLRAAAEKGGAAALWLAPPGGPRLPAALRLEIGGPEEGAAAGRPGRVRMARAGRPGAIPRGDGGGHAA
jgi:protein ImuA